MMKKIIFALGVLLSISSTFMIFSCVEMPRQDSIYGVWKGESQGKALLFKFCNDGTCELNFKDNTIASSSTETLTGNFVLDLSKKLICLDIRNIPQLNHSLYTIVEFKGDDSIRMAYFAKRWRLRPIVFNQNRSINLRKYEVSAQ